MAELPRIDAGFQVGVIPPGVSKLRYYYRLLVRHIRVFSSFDRFSFWEGIIAGLLKAPLTAGSIYITGALVDSIVAYYQSPLFLTIWTVQIPQPIAYIILLFVLNRVYRLLDLIVQLASIRIRNNALVQYRELVAVAYHRFNSQEVDKERIKDLFTKIDTYWYNSAIDLYARMMGVGEFLLSILISFVAICTFSPLAAVLVLLVPVFEIYALYRHYRRHSAFVDEIAPLMLGRTYFFSALTDPRTFAERKVNGVFRALIKRYKYFAELVNTGYKRVLALGQKQITGAAFFDNVVLLVLKIYVIMSGLVDKLPVGHITYIIGYIDSLYNNSYAIQECFISMFDDLTFVSYLYEFTDIRGFADRGIKKGRRLKKQEIPHISVRDITFAYGDTGKKILENASLDIKPGDKILIMGKDGSGKSSILSLLAGLYQITQGEIRYDDIPITKLARGEVKGKISVVPEDFARYYMTLKENIVLGDPRKRFDEALYRKALDITGLTQWIREAKIDEETTMLGNYFDGGVSLSSGHWQRIAIARAIYRNREVFLLDQPFTYIDKHSVKEIFPRLMRFIGKRTLIFISEEYMFKEYFTRVLEVEDKKLVEKKPMVRKRTVVTLSGKR